MRTLILGGLVALAPLVSPTAAQISTAQPGYEIVDSLPFGTTSVRATLSDGRYVEFDGERIELFPPDGSAPLLLADLGGFVFPSFLLLDPSETFVVAGESSTGQLLCMDLAGGGARSITTLADNFAATFDLDPAWLMVSAAATTFGENEIYRVEVATGDTTSIASVEGFSGPVALDADGDLYYISSPSSGTPLLLRWTRAQVDGGVLLDESDAQVVSDELAGGLALLFDPQTEHFLVVESDFSADDRILELGAQGEILRTVVTSSDFIGAIELLDAGGDETFQAFQPAGERLAYVVTDFFAFPPVAVRNLVEPRRPVLTITGPSSGPAMMQVEVTGAEPNAAVQFTMGPRAFTRADEVTLPLLAYAPVFSRLELGEIQRRFRRPTDSTGRATFSYYDAGTLHGRLVWQGILEGTASALLGSSVAAFN